MKAIDREIAHKLVVGANASIAELTERSFYGNAETIIKLHQLVEIAYRYEMALQKAVDPNSMQLYELHYKLCGAICGIVERSMLFTDELFDVINSLVTDD